MSQVLLAMEQREQALQRLGYTPRESRFLCLAGLHSGYFLRRQYDRFLGRSDGGTATQMIEKALAKGHARAFTYRPRTHLYHLCSRPFYDALGQVDNRNRRRRQPLTIKNKLMALDFVLGHEGAYLATEQEKAEFFTHTLQVPLSALPTKLYLGARPDAQTARYFIDKHPIFLPRKGFSGRPPVVSFCFVDEGVTTLSRFETYLAQYRRLFAAVPQFTVIYVAGTLAHFEGAKRAFERLAGVENNVACTPVTDPEIRRMLDYFAARHRYETKQLDGFDRERLLQLRRDREAFSGAKYDALYERWTIEKEPGIFKTLGGQIASFAPAHGSFSTCILEHNYDLFGSLVA